MLLQLIIHNFVIVDRLEVDFSANMTAITGETGAGKSIAIDALGLCLGQRAETNMIRQDAKELEVCAQFSLSDAPSALAWLQENHLDEDDECILRRVVGRDGRSKAYINGKSVPVVQLKELGYKLIQIHGQHSHQLLLKPDYQQSILDGYLDNDELMQQMRHNFAVWQKNKQDLQHYQQKQTENEMRSQLLLYQLQELDEFAPQDEEYEQLDLEYKRLVNHEKVVELSHSGFQLLSENDDVNALSLIYTVKTHIEEIVSLAEPKFEMLLSMLSEAEIQLQEVSQELQHYADSLECDPLRINDVEQRLSKYLALARKHQVAPTELATLYHTLQQECQQLSAQHDQLTVLQEAVIMSKKQAVETAKQLHKQRLESAEILSNAITTRIKSLSMPHAKLAITLNFNEDHLTQTGADKVEFLVSTNPGQPLHGFSKVLSGGELSRIALAIQVVTAAKRETPALIFDEVDVGISGSTAAQVGRELHQLGQSTQVICVTHLPQVAGSADYHFFVNKQTNLGASQTNMLLLDENGRLDELARLLAGDKITEITRANAKELLIK